MKFHTIQGLFLRLFLTIMGGALFSVEEYSLSPAGVQIVHRPPFRSCPWYVCFTDQQEIAYQGLSGIKTKNLYAELKELILAGYRLHSDIAERDICDDRFFQAGVREWVSHREPFYSGELKSLFSRIENLINAGKGGAIEDPGRWEKMGQNYITKWIYPKGFTRVWAVIDYKETQVKRFSKHDRVIITLRAEPVALEGTLHEWDAVDGGPPAGSLLFLKRRLDPHAPKVEVPRSVERFFDDGKKHDVASLIWRKGGKAQCVFLTNEKMYAVSQGFFMTFSHPEVSFSCRLRLPPSSLWWYSLSRGYVFKHPASGAVDLEAAHLWPIRRVLCYTQDFVCENLQTSIASLSEEVMVCEKEGESSE